MQSGMTQSDTDLSKLPKNSFSFSYAFGYTKTNVNNFPDVLDGWLYRLYRSKAPTKGVLGYSYGFEYKRHITPKWWLSLGMQYSRMGQASPRFYSIAGIPDSELDARPGYGGSQYQLVYQSINFPLLLHYERQATQTLRFIFSGGVLFNVYDQITIQNFVFDRASGEKEAGCCTVINLPTEGGAFATLERQIGAGLVRFGGRLGTAIEYTLSPHFGLVGGLLFDFYSNFYDQGSAAFSTSGTAYQMLLNLGIAFKI